MKSKPVSNQDQDQNQNKVPSLPKREDEAVRVDQLIEPLELDVDDVLEAKKDKVAPQKAKNKPEPR